MQKQIWAIWLITNSSQARGGVTAAAFDRPENWQQFYPRPGIQMESNPPALENTAL